MPKVKSYLTQMQSEEAEVKAVSQQIIDRMNETRGRENKGKQEFAKEVGVSFPTWKRWNNNGIGSSDFRIVMIALIRSGYTMKIVPKDEDVDDENPKRKKAATTRTHY